MEATSCLLQLQWNSAKASCCVVFSLPVLLPRRKQEAGSCRKSNCLDAHCHAQPHRHAATSACLCLSYDDTLCLFIIVFLFFLLLPSSSSSSSCLCPVSTCYLFFTAGNELDIAEKTPARQWVAGVYFAVMLITTTGLGDMKPCTPAEEILGSAQMLLGVFLFGLIISTSQ